MHVRIIHKNYLVIGRLFMCDNAYRKSSREVLHRYANFEMTNALQKTSETVRVYESLFFFLQKAFFFLNLSSLFKVLHDDDCNVVHCLYFNKQLPLSKKHKILTPSNKSSNIEQE